ncbi:glycerophosphodiester phosphodiesterase family protein [Oricola sp.]|uniref:glycerophosphodiester phosphodiesterase family protein n=1 Tax=Oricola sp. TaxID=1979950 RepID=UPI0025E0142B|nr:glycerophosphodiester phosphodiesterase family protein [Oricola sp.]MCI5077833.1 glycerophosphodiester phosphodiesterase [Oricola sp.]
MRKVLVVVAVIVGALYLWNASWIAGEPGDPQIRTIAHRGVHQAFSREGLTSDTCTAERILPPEHAFIENTIPSMRAAFEAGADVVELDVHATTDGQFAVIHDWTVDCRTDGEGVTREHDMATLKRLDVGYGYTADGGKTFPLRGTGVGQMPELKEVLEAFPDGRFLVNFKSREAREGDMLAAVLTEHPEWRDRVWSAYGGDAPTERANEQIEGLNGYGVRQMKGCLMDYLKLGWSGYVPETCRNTHVMVPGNLAWLAWGWPHRFRARMEAAGSDIILFGPYSKGDPGTRGIDSLEELKLIPAGFDGYVWTNRIEVIGPALAGR